MESEIVKWKVEGMDCTTCALNISKYLEREGLKNVKVNFATGDVLFEEIAEDKKEKVAKGIEGLGYKVVNGEKVEEKTRKPFLSTHLHRFLFCLPFTLVLMLHMLDKWVHLHWLMNPWIQLALCLPVYIVG